MTKIIDLRSDTVTRPTPAMRAAMLVADVGDDVFGDDPTVNLLQEKLADMVGMEAALFLPSGTQSNLCALMAHCNRGDEYIVGQHAHTYKYEGGGAAVLGSIQPQPIEHALDGTLPIEKIRECIKPIDDHFAVTKLIALENTIGGKVIAASYMKQVKQLAIEKNLALHLDGARIFNAAVKTERDVKSICAVFDSVSICLSKGLGAPMGSVLCGARDIIKQARRHRKMLGGGLRQAGILAAAGIYALDHHVERLAVDHDNAARLAAGLAGLGKFNVSTPDTNILFIDIAPNNIQALQSHMDNAGIKLIVGERTRLVTHLDIDEADIVRTVDAFAAFVTFNRR
jgi:threonine aldolase